MDIDIFRLVKKVREQKPVVHHLTNWVTIYDCANIVKVFGGSPIMAHAPEEVAEMSSIASSLVLNIGTLTPDFVDAMEMAARSANSKGTPVILDVCGAGATRLRDAQCHRLLQRVKIDVVKGNVSEIARVAGEDVRTKGVDSGEYYGKIETAMEYLAHTRRCTVVATGKEDYVTDGSRTFVVRNGHPMMENVVGTGCMATSVIGTFCAAETDLAFASAAGLAAYEIAAEIAVAGSHGPGTFKQQLYDAVYSLDRETVEKMKKIELLHKQPVSGGK